MLNLPGNGGGGPCGLQPEGGPEPGGPGGPGGGGGIPEKGYRNNK